MRANIRERLFLLLGRVEAVLRASRGQTLAEYGLILTVVATVIVVTALTVFRLQLGDAFTNAGDCIDGC
jgi:Flp pilus assembly pilin Flp